MHGPLNVKKQIIQATGLMLIFENYRAPMHFNDF